MSINPDQGLTASMDSMIIERRLVLLLAMVRLWSYRDFIIGTDFSESKCSEGPTLSIPVVTRTAAWLVLGLPWQSHVTNEIRTRLHWIDVPSQVQFNVIPHLLSYFSLPWTHFNGVPIFVRPLLAYSAFRIPGLSQLIRPRTWTITINPQTLIRSSCLEQSWLIFVIPGMFSF